MESAHGPQAGDDRRHVALSRLEILDALVIALDNRQRVLDVVESASDADQARPALMREFHFNDVQAVAVLDLQMRRFAATERRRITDQRNELLRELQAPR